jgi:lambda repressor-like predicted transcriptional regulator
MPYRINQNDIKKTIRFMLCESGLTSFAALSRELDLKETTLRSSLSNNSMRLRDFAEAANIMGFEVIVRRKQS